jgi:hypothetical protein
MMLRSGLDMLTQLFDASLGRRRMRRAPRTRGKNSE